MPSPFPGMDPFLEHPDFFPDLHGRFHVYLSEALQDLLPPPYFAVIHERLWVEPSARYIEPNTDVMIEIRTRLAEGGERVVTAIEVLSLSNKRAGDHGRDLYLQKQGEILGSAVHLVEIDLLRGGEHTTPVLLDRLKRKAGAFQYHVSVHRFDQRGRFFIYPWQLADALPVIGVPLLPGEDEIPLDLQAVLTRCYDTGPYARRVVYDPARIVAPLDPQQTAWVQQRLQTAETL